MIEQVKELQQKSKFEAGFLVESPPEIVEKMPAPELRAGSSADRMLKKILDCIRDEGIQKIGIWGMGGVGKTTLMTMLNNADEIKDMFEFVIWITVSKSWRVGNLQDIIANRLSLDIKESNGGRKSEHEVMTMLFREIKSKRCLVLMDDVWDMMDLSKVGIPITKEQKGSKVVLTTRDKKVCRKLETDVEIMVEVLEEKEAWEMFCLKVGDIAEFPAIKQFAKEIVRKCCGLPLALNAIGGALRKFEDADVWLDLLNKLKWVDANSRVSNDMNEEVFQQLKLSYDRLKDANSKKCFLYCGLYPEDHQIPKSDLIEYWRADGLLWSRGTFRRACRGTCPCCFILWMHLL